MLEDRVGDFDKNADAAYRTVQVLEHVEKFDEDGKRLTSDDIGNGEINGFTSSGDARHGTEAGRLQDFGKYGFTNLKGELNHIDSAADDEDARAEAEGLGIQWERPEDDDRSAEEIVNDSELLKNLGNQSGVKDMLKERVGDFENDADAAYRAVQLLEHVERFDEDGKRIAGNEVGNGEINGFTSSDEAKHGTEAGRLQDFGKYGFTNLKGELNYIDSAADDEEVRADAEELGIQWERPEDDDRSAEEIVNDSELLKNLGNQSGVKDMLKERVGDFENDADAAYRAVQLLEHVERFDEDGKRIASNEVGNGEINGFTSSDEAKHGTEAGRLQDFGKYGFSHLKGELTLPETVGDNEKAREEAEAAGIDWELPEDDDRSAENIIEDSPLLKNLGNQSGVKDMLKERVGDFENDADAAYRASQVLDRIVMYDGEGKSQSGNGVANTSIDGFTNSGEAKHGTEAGRLQDFGKYGFETLKEVKKPEDIGSYKDFLKANPDADDISKQMAKYAAIIDENYDAIRGKTDSGKYLTAEALQQYKDENPQISDDFKDALDFWSQPGAFNILDTSKHSLAQNTDGDVSKNDLSNWLTNDSPKDSGSAIAFISEVANANTTANVDKSELGADVFENPDNYSAKEKAAVLQDLLTAQKLINKGAEAGMWQDDYGKVSIANAVRGHPDPEKLLQDVNDHIAILQDDQEVVDYLNENSTREIDALFESNEGLKKAVEGTYEDEIKSGKALDALWETNTKDGKTDQQTALASFFQSAQTFQSVLGIDDLKEIQGAVSKSEHAGEFKDYYENQIASGERYKELLDDGDNSFEEATSAFTMEVALYNSALDPEFTGELDNKLNENFQTLAQENAFKDASFDDLKTAFGKDGGDELDEEKVKKLIDEINETNPEFFINANGKKTTPDQILAGFRGEWDLLRQGSKTLNELKLLDPNGSLKEVYGKGGLHGVSGLFMAGITIAKGASGSGKLTDRQIVDIATGSVMSATIMTEGGAKGYLAHLKDVKGKLEGDLLDHVGSLLDDVSPESNSLQDAKSFNKYLTDVTQKFEQAAKGLGGIAGVAAGAYGIFDGVQMLRNGDKVGGALSITAGAMGTMAGLASAVEGSLGLVLSSIPRIIPVLAGGLGVAAAGVGAIVALIPGLIEEGKRQVQQDKFGELLSDYLTQYEVDGVPYGDYWDIPDEEWPGYDDGALHGS
ncbi:type III effector HrpK [Salinicola corii]|uniref:Type III effector HrpK n=2 Tax=Salinicola corii TaxID=2606937 RepID=A0A640W779_9GAMM|nr:type III effector HrpK [Salinicola corii]